VLDNIKLHDLPNGIIYIENAFPESVKFLQELEDNDNNEALHGIIPKWQEWEDGFPRKITNDDGTVHWEQVYENEDGHRGTVKYVDWDRTLTDGNNMWPRPVIDQSYDQVHEDAYKILEKIDKPYVELLKVWAEKTGNDFPSTWITKNYTIRKYKTGGHMGPHVDKNTENPDNSMDWTALIYLNDDYGGGELVFDDLNLTLKPSAGSIVFFPCLESHLVNKITSGNKTYIFMFIHLDVGISTSLGESYQGLTKLIKASRLELS
jgi:hypothetical protein